TESLVRGFRYSFDRAILDWRFGARELERYRATTGETDSNVRVVRYEELVADLEAVLEPVLRFCGLDPAAYDFDTARRLPVMGSRAIAPRDLSDDRSVWQSLPVSGGSLAERVAELEWYHTMELPDGTVTPGLFDHRPVIGRYGLPDRLDGLRVLDCGTFDG